VLGALLLKAAVKADVTPSTAMLDYFREHLEEESRYEADVRGRLDALNPPHPGFPPPPAIRRVCGIGRLSRT
jgi:hypothetical protein